mmetsp:Transcript_29012/g.40805  ORF Transcript_29012/g.40805 Transcript_29012/m.40805 type:complete len:96 (-) Transcript_29012:41-328(-)|eukprot:CAMPEP_0175100146 /NCGR_PEP_ID=MMETSP0086_2-20121207/6905_1 /TAXON_ID=136419 /ORGANISM="Unknown Unknown, Strain D1" /LENGTH=95 /DNA_ID=CAMNT_0016374185 /DNA_START=184 /DNA_END=471 /DNA_ORIENTATION=+
MGKYNTDGRVIEVIVVSGDSDKAGFLKTMEGYDWLAIPFDELKARKADIEKHVPCTGYPTPGVINAQTGKVLNEDAYEEINSNPKAFDGWLAECK